MKWISVEDRLPEINEWVLVFSPSEFNVKQSHVGRLEGGGSSFEIGHYPFDYYGECSNFGVTHWMPLPNPPKGESK